MKLLKFGQLLGNQLLTSQVKKISCISSSEIYKYVCIWYQHHNEQLKCRKIKSSKQSPMLHVNHRMVTAQDAGNLSNGIPGQLFYCHRNPRPLSGISSTAVQLRTPIQWLACVSLISNSIYKSGARGVAAAAGEAEMNVTIFRLKSPMFTMN